MATSGMISGQTTTIEATVDLTPAVLEAVTSITLPELAMEDVDLTALTDATGKRYVPGMLDPGTMSFTINYTDATAVELYDGWAAGTIYSWTVKFAGSADDKFTASGFIQELSGEIPEGSGVVTQSVTVQLTNDTTPTYASASA